MTTEAQHPEDICRTPLDLSRDIDTALHRRLLQTAILRDSDLQALHKKERVFALARVQRVYASTGWECLGGKEFGERAVIIDANTPELIEGTEVPCYARSLREFMAASRLPDDGSWYDKLTRTPLMNVPPQADGTPTMARPPMADAIALPDPYTDTLEFKRQTSAIYDAWVSDIFNGAPSHLPRPSYERFIELLTRFPESFYVVFKTHPQMSKPPRNLFEGRGAASASYAQGTAPFKAPGEGEA